jgi:hypothetical protein
VLNSAKGNPLCLHVAVEGAKKAVARPKKAVALPSCHITSVLWSNVPRFVMLCRAVSCCAGCDPVQAPDANHGSTNHAGACPWLDGVLMHVWSCRGCVCSHTLHITTHPGVRALPTVTAMVAAVWCGVICRTPCLSHS